MTASSRRVLVRDIRPLSPEEVAWRRKSEKKQSRTGLYITLAIAAGLVLFGSIVVGIYIGRS